MTEFEQFNLIWLGTTTVGYARRFVPTDCYGAVKYVHLELSNSSDEGEAVGWLPDGATVFFAG